MTENVLSPHIKVHNLGVDDAGQAIVSLSFVDMVAFTTKVKAWVGRVIELMEASGVQGLSISSDEALDLFLAGVSAEDAATKLIETSPPADEAEPDAIVVTDPSDELVSVPRLPTSAMIQAARYAANLPDGRLAAIWDAMVDAAAEPAA